MMVICMVRIAKRKTHDRAETSKNLKIFQKRKRKRKERSMLRNILITGTPGVGKTTFSDILGDMLSMRVVHVGDLVREKSLHDGYDEEFDTFILNEDKVCDELEDIMQQQNVIVDFHTCDFFPERWFTLVVVLRASTHELYSRLEKRFVAVLRVTLFFLISRVLQRLLREVLSVQRLRGEQSAGEC